MELLEILNRLIMRLIKKQIVRAKVLSVDTEEWTCEVETLEGGIKRFEVKLRAVADGEETGFILIPSVDSIVLIGIVDNNESDGFIAKYSQVDGLVYVIKDKTELRSTSDGKWKWVADTHIHFDGATNGLIKIPKIVERVNNIENDINVLKSVFSGWTPVPNDGGSALKAASVSWFGSNLSVTTENDIKHDKIEF